MDRQHLLSDQDEATGGTILDQGQFSNGVPGECGTADGASAPPAGLMDVVPGYEGIGTADGYLPPPSQDIPQPPAPSPHAANRPWQVPSISEELAKEAFIEFASQKCCYGTKPAKQMVFTDLHSLNTYRYRLETFNESRSTKWASEPYSGQVVDGGMGVPPGPWDLPVQFPALFQNGSQDVRIPYTSSVKGCHTCMTLGKIACRKCVTSGRTQCGFCNGRGRSSTNNQCGPCSGNGQVRCSSCSGMGTSVCKTCRGKGQLLCYLKLTVTWKNNVQEIVVDKQSGFPIDRVSKVTGETLFTDMQYLVYPVAGFPDNSVNQASAQAVREHQAQFASTSRILQQRQTIELIPITRVHYTWKEKTYIYFVYGVENKIHTDDYPAKCGCCTII